MVHNHKRYSEEFKKQIVNLHLSGKSAKALANEYGNVYIDEKENILNQDFTASLLW